MKTLLKVLKWILIALITIIILFVVYVQLAWDKTFDIPYQEVTLSTDSSIIAKGRYLAFGPAHCVDCHAPRHLIEESIKTGEALTGYPPLSGGYIYKFDLGKLHFPNITPDPETGIGRYSDGQLARLLRYGVTPLGHAMLPVMEYQNIRDEDLVAILSFLRSQQPVRNEVPSSEYNFMGKAVKTFLVRPIPPEGTPPLVSPSEEVTLERGEYLANRIGQCAQCHTKRNELDFSLNAPRLSGGMELIENWAPDLIFVPPNLTPDPETGHIVNWTEEQFITRFRAGSLVQGSPMPWNFYARMSDTDLKAIFLYLKSIDPVRNEMGPLVRNNDK